MAQLRPLEVSHLGEVMCTLWDKARNTISLRQSLFITCGAYCLLLNCPCSRRQSLAGSNSDQGGRFLTCVFCYRSRSDWEKSPTILHGSAAALTSLGGLSWHIPGTYTFSVLLGCPVLCLSQHQSHNNISLLQAIRGRGRFSPAHQEVFNNYLEWMNGYINNTANKMFLSKAAVNRV